MGFKPDQHQSHIESVNEFRKRMEYGLNKAKVALVKSKDNMAKYMIKEGHQLQNTNLETKCTWTPVTSTPPDPLGSSLTGG